MIEMFIASGLVVAFCVGWLFGDDHGRTTTNRQWLDEKDQDWKHITIIKNGGVQTHDV